MPDWIYIDSTDHEAAKVVNNLTHKYFECRTTEKVDVSTNHSLSQHTFLCNRPAADPVVDNYVDDKNPVVSVKIVEESTNINNDENHTLV